MSVGRTQPYTERGISRVPCYRCGEASSQQWDVCALGNRYLGVCTGCDVLLNRKVLEFFGVPEIPHLIAQYERRLRRPPASEGESDSG